MSHDLESTLRQFDNADMNAQKLEEILSNYHESLNSGDKIVTDKAIRKWDRFVEALPPIDGFKPEKELLTQNEIENTRADYWFAGIPEAPFEQSLEDPERELAKYRDLLKGHRRSLIRSDLGDLIGEVDALLDQTEEVEDGHAFLPSRTDGWKSLSNYWNEIQALVGPDMPEAGRWTDMTRHQSFAQPHDLSDIVLADWPSVRQSIIDHLFHDEPIPSEASDLAKLASHKPQGPVSTELNWAVLDAESFERLVFAIFQSIDSYENLSRLMKTNASDKGRDFSADRIIKDPLAGVSRIPIMVQCKHYQAQSVDLSECTKSVDQAKLWPNAGFRVVIVVTSGFFTQQAIEWQERRNTTGDFPAVEFVGQSNLESLLANRPPIRNFFNL